MKLKIVSPKSKKPKYLCQVVRCTRKARPGRDMCDLHSKMKIDDPKPHELTIKQAEALIEDVEKIVNIVAEGADFMHDVTLLLNAAVDNEPVNKTLLYRVFFDARNWADNVENDVESLLESFRNTIRGVVEHGGRKKHEKANLERLEGFVGGSVNDDCGA